MNSRWLALSASALILAGVPAMGHAQPLSQSGNFLQGGAGGNNSASRGLLDGVVSGGANVINDSSRQNTSATDGQGGSQSTRSDSRAQGVEGGLGLNKTLTGESGSSSSQAGNGSAGSSGRSGSGVLGLGSNTNFQAVDRSTNQSSSASNANGDTASSSRGSRNSALGVNNSTNLSLGGAQRSVANSAGGNGANASDSTRARNLDVGLDVGVNLNRNTSSSSNSATSNGQATSSSTSQSSRNANPVNLGVSLGGNSLTQSNNSSSGR